MARVVVSGALANRPENGGGAWVRLNWVLGLQQLGHQVHFVEEINRRTCIARDGSHAPFEDSCNLAFFRAVTADYGISTRATLVFESGEQTAGLAFNELTELAASADLLINISGHLTTPALFGKFRRKAYLDLDPGFTQFWHADGNPGSRLAGHDEYYSVGANIGTPGCLIPTGNIHWRPIRPPVVLDEWPVTTATPNWRFTTVASWRGPFGPVDYAGKTYGVKVHEFRKFLELPVRTGLPFEIALNIHPGDASDREAIIRQGWRLTDPVQAAASPGAFRRYIQQSGAEFSAAQGVYVETRSGWFSDRTSCYLAAGKPVLVQDTGIGQTLPLGEGLIAFRTLEDAVTGAEVIARDYEHHCRAARTLAEKYFDSRKVIATVLRDFGLEN